MNFGESGRFGECELSEEDNFVTSSVRNIRVVVQFEFVRGCRGTAGLPLEFGHFGQAPGS